MAEKPTTGKVSSKAYQCTTCGAEKEEKTNHWGDIYIHCDVCRTTTVWECEDEIPEEYKKPEPWDLEPMANTSMIKCPNCGHMNYDMVVICQGCLIRLKPW